MPDADYTTATLAHFEANAAAVLAEMRRTGRAVKLTGAGGPDVVVADLTEHRRLRAAAETIQLIASLKKAREDIDAGRGTPMDDFFERIAADYNFPELLK